MRKIGLLVVLGIVCGCAWIGYQYWQIRLQIETHLAQDYLWPETQLRWGRLQQAVAQLPDRYSAIISAQEMEQLDRLKAGEYQGLGLSYEIEDDLAVIYQVMPGSPAETVGLQTGDTIRAIGQEPVEHLSPSQVDTMLRPAIGQTVTLNVLKASSQVVNRQLQAQTFPLQTVAYRLLNSEMAYLQIFTFARQSKEELAKVIDQITEDEISQLVIDVRGNGGGASGSSHVLLDALIPDGDVVRWRDNTGYNHITQVSQAGKLLPLELDVVILVDKHTASEAEIMAAALHDFGKAIIFGETTYGKGQSVEHFPLNDGRYLRLVTGEWTRPNGQSVEGIGIEPDVYASEIEEWSAIAWREVW